MSPLEGEKENKQADFKLFFLQFSKLILTIEREPAERYDTRFFPFLRQVGLVLQKADFFVPIH